MARISVLWPGTSRILWITWFVYIRPKYSE